MKKRYFILFFIYSLASAQENLVYNGDFELYSACPNGFSDPTQFPKEIEKCIGWKAPTYGTSDYFNVCSSNPSNAIPYNGAGYQLPKSGNGYLGALLTNYNWGTGDDGYNGIMWWEYIQGQLNQTLEKDKTYKLTLYTSLGEISDLMINEIGVYFSSTPIFSLNTASLNVIPQCTFYDENYFADSVGWQKLETIYVAKGNENFITIGNFKNNLVTDTLRRFDLSPEDLNPLYTYMYFDDIELVDISEEFQIPNIFTPNGDNINDTWKPLITLNGQEVIIVNRWGNPVNKLNENNNSWDGKDQTGKSVTEGEYFYIIKDKESSKTIFQGVVSVIF